MGILPRRSLKAKVAEPKPKVIRKNTKYYPAEDAPTPKPKKKNVPAKALRKAITPGTILILLAGRFRGKRVVFLKRLESGLLLVTGPYKVNGVPLRRVNQAYVIATSTKLDLKDHKIPDEVNDTYFAKEKSKEKGSAEQEFFEEGKPKAKEAYPEKKSSTQKSTDTGVLAAIKGVEHMSNYLRSTFGLSKGQFPHQMSF
ncbi:hypothetical protein FRB94_008127 [Tulasnella sp. JGI-2019a]|nr:hypothetical protein FRB94_008127 [Tulasnella sp. JGI-2019a]KAG9017320.1 hypothetical protein FRB93_007434 [Tulasnella sp. JGI-2019a]KAG9026457.1 hypothetical protein FRB95_008829 [Tulasnella sp. JGI-2019a]